MTELALRARSFGLEAARFAWKDARVWLASALLFALLFAVDPAQGVASLGFTLDALLETAPYLLLSIGIAAYAGASGADNLIARAFTGSPLLMIVLAALAGGLSPFCSCGVIPLIAALLAMGVPLSAVMAFWLASPVMDPSMFILTTGNGGCGGAKVRSAKPVVWRFWQEDARVAKFAREAWKTTLFLGQWLTLAFAIESLMLAFVPAEWIAGVLGGEGLLPIATATLVGVPAYLNGYAALPVVAGLIGQGMAGGAGLAFLVAGGVTSLPAAIAVFALVKQRVFLLYLALALSGSFMAGLIFQAFLAAA